jgi:hypothetical protein
MPQRQCSLLAVHRRGGRRRDATGSSQRLEWSTLARARGRNFSGGQRGEEQRKGTGLGGYRAL